MNKLSFKQKFLLILFGILVAFVGAEILFRIGGFIANKTILQTANIAHKANTTILCVGDSSTYGLGASNTDRFSYPAQLQALLDEKVHSKTFKVVNLGAPGMNSSQVLHRFRENILKYKPDIVIMMIGINDPWNLEENEVLENYNAASVYDKVLFSFQLLLNKLRVYQFFKLIYVSTENELPRSKLRGIKTQRDPFVVDVFVYILPLDPALEHNCV